MLKLEGLNGPVSINPDHVTHVAVPPVMPDKEGNWTRVHFIGGGNVIVEGDTASVASQINSSSSTDTGFTPPAE